jgi:hypothetical protein
MSRPWFSLYVSLCITTLTRLILSGLEKSRYVHDPAPREDAGIRYNITQKTLNAKSQPLVSASAVISCLLFKLLVLTIHIQKYGAIIHQEFPLKDRRLKV